MNERKKELEKMTVLGGLNDLARKYDIDINHMRKGEIIEAILQHENPPKKKRPPRNQAKTKLKAVRVASGMPQTQLAELADINPRTLQFYEQGSKSFDSARLETIVKVAIVLKCKIDDILESEELIALINEYRQTNK